MRTTEEVNLATQQSETTRVFNAAETGIERALTEGNFSNSVTYGTPTTQGADTNYTITPSSVFEATLRQGQPVSVNLSGSSPTNSVTLRWAKESSGSDRASLVVAVYYTDNTVDYYSLGNPLAFPNNRNDSFTDTNATTQDGYRNEYPLSFSKPASQLRIIPVYKDTALTIAGSIPVQTHIIRSEAKNSNDSASGGLETRAVEVKRTLPMAPSFMDYAVYARGGVVKNDN